MGITWRIGDGQRRHVLKTECLATANMACVVHEFRLQRYSIVYGERASKLFKDAQNSCRKAHYKAQRSTEETKICHDLHM